MEKEKKIHNKPSKLGTYLGKKAGVDDDLLQDSDNFLQETNEIKQDAEIDALVDSAPNPNKEELIQSKTAPSDVNVETPKKKSWLKRLSVLFMSLTVVAVVYAGLFILAPVIIIVPAAFLYLIWFAIVAFMSIVTIGLIWINDGWKDFSQGFLDFNNGLWDFANHTTEVMASTFKGITIGLGCCVVMSILISTIGMSSKRFSHEKYKASMIASIILGVVFVAFTILNIYFINSGKSFI